MQITNTLGRAPSSARPWPIDPCIVVLLLAFGCMPQVAWASRSDVRKIKQAVGHVEREEWVEALTLLEPLRSDDDSLIQSAVHYSLGAAYQGNERSLDATDAYLRVMEMKATPKGQRDKAYEALEMIYKDSALGFRTPELDQGVERLHALTQRLGPESPLRPWILYTLADAQESNRDLRRSLEGFEYLGEVFNQTRPGLAGQARERAAQLRRQYFSGLSVPCKPDERQVYFSVQNAGLGNGPIYSQQCSTDPVFLDPGRHGVVIWRRPDKKASSPPFASHHLVQLNAGQRLELDYLLEPAPEARTFSPVTAAVGGGLILAGLTAHFASAAASDDDPSNSLLTAAVGGYMAGGALLIGELVRLGMNGGSLD